VLSRSGSRTACAKHSLSSSLATKHNLSSATQYLGPRRSDDPLAGHSVRRSVQREANERVLAHRLQEVSEQIPRLVAAIRSRNECIATLQTELENVRHALDVAQSRIWQPQPAWEATFSTPAREAAQRDEPRSSVPRVCHVRIHVAGKA